MICQKYDCYCVCDNQRVTKTSEKIYLIAEEYDGETLSNNKVDRSILLSMSTTEKFLQMKRSTFQPYTSEETLTHDNT